MPTPETRELAAMLLELYKLLEHSGIIRGKDLTATSPMGIGLVEGIHDRLREMAREGEEESK